MTKTCSTCRTSKPVDGFHRNRHRPDGRHSQCKICVKKDNARWRAANPDKKRAQNTGTDRLRWRLAAYGLTPCQYTRLLVKQGGRCAICLTTDPGDRAWNIDHDHACCDQQNASCGKCVRGLLCRTCNVALGLMRDDADALRRAASYIEG